MQKFLNRLSSRSAAACPGQGLRSSSSPATKHRDNSDGSDSSRTDLPDPIPNQRIIQAWRVVTWPEGVYSIAKFELKPHGSGTRLVFDHTGFPEGLHDHLAEGWGVKLLDAAQEVFPLESSAFRIEGNEQIA